MKKLQLRRTTVKKLSLNAVRTGLKAGIIDKRIKRIDSIPPVESIVIKD